MPPARPSLSAAVIARDEERLLPDCLGSLTFADERLVLVDAATADRSREVARACGARLEERVFDNFAGQRNAALALAQADWVLFVDADERVSPGLRDEVLARIAAPAGCRGFWIPRRNFFGGRLVRGAGWSPDYQLRLLERAHARFDPSRGVHEVPIVDGPVGYLEAAFTHLNYRSLREFIRKQERYCRLDAVRWRAEHGPPRLRAFIGQPVREFWRRYVRLGGYREGALGVVLCGLLAYYAGKTVWLARRLAQLGDGGDLAHAEDERAE